MNIYIAMGIFVVLGIYGYHLLCSGDSSLQAETIDLFNSLVSIKLTNA